jgi:hypothetical protein
MFRSSASQPQPEEAPTGADLALFFALFLAQVVFLGALNGCSGGQSPTDSGQPTAPVGGSSGETLPNETAGTAGAAAGAPTVEGPAGPQAVTNAELCDPTVLEVGPTPLRRLSRIEYNNAVRDLLGDTTQPAASFVAEEKVLGFSSNSVTAVTEVINEQYLDAALQIAERALPTLASRWPCVAQGGEVCARQVLHDLGRQAYRGALDSTEEDRLLALYTATATALDDAAGLQASIAAILTSPRFLFTIELGAVGTTEAVVPLSQHETAARLAFFLWRSLPDETLLAAADRGELATAEQVEAQARRLFEDPKANDALDDFVQQWVRLENMAALNKSSMVYPEFSEALKQSLLQETLTFYRETVRGPVGSVATLLTSSQSYVNRQLAQQYYNVGSSAPDETSFVLTELNSDPNNPRRAGLLTQGSVLAMQAHPTRASPVHRGKLVREQLLCQPLPPPPPNVKNTLPEGQQGEVTRDVFSQHATDPSCAGCHRLMDPIGYGFGHYDGMGKYLDDENGQPIDANGEVVSAGPALDGPFSGAVELANKLASSGLVEPCFAVQLSRYALGRAETNSDACSLQASYAAFQNSGFQVRELMAAIARSDSFRLRRRVDAGLQCQ